MKISLKTFLFFACASPLLIQCGSVFLSPEDKPPTSSVANEPYSGPLRGQVVPSRDANRYMVHLQWTVKPERAALTLFRKELPNGTALEIESLPPDSSSWIDAQVEGGKSYEYRLQGAGTDEVSVVAIPKDLEFRGGIVVLTESIRASRLFLLQGTELVIEDRDITIEVDEIVSEDGTISTFPNGNQAPVNQNGRNGGRLTLSANSLTGTLKVKMDGEKGGKGLPGINGNPGQRGTQGYHAIFRCYGINNTITECPAETVRARSQILSCVRTPSDGSIGTPGSAGGNGGTGRNGGNRGHATVSIRTFNPQNLIVSASPGEGGPGGDAGRGGPGGEGGLPGYEVFGVCPAQNGPQGPNGADGQPGIPGQPGQ